MPPPFSQPVAASQSPTLDAGAPALTGIDLLNTYAHIFIIAFIVTLLVTPAVKYVAESLGIVDRPDFNRKAHTYPVAYLGGMAVFLGLIAAIGISYVTTEDVPPAYAPV